VTLPTVFLLGDSTVTDQPAEPAASWGQMLPAFFTPDIAIANHAESGETMKSFMTELRFAKVLELAKPGDWALIQFGHNDQKANWPQTYAAAETTYRDYLRTWIADPMIDVVISTGGTGLTGRDVTVEAFRSLFEKEIDGFSVLFHQISFGKVGTSTVQSRACAGVAKGTYLFALPGSPGAVKDGWDGILKFQLDIRHKPCNFVEIMPRLLEDPLSRRGG